MENTCKYCRWWERYIWDDKPSDFGKCLYPLPADILRGGTDENQACQCFQHKEEREEK
jgi:hypothetical protein